MLTAHCSPTSCPSLLVQPGLLWLHVRFDTGWAYLGQSSHLLNGPPGANSSIGLQSARSCAWNCTPGRSHGRTSARLYWLGGNPIQTVNTQYSCPCQHLNNHLHSMARHTTNIATSMAHCHHANKYSQHVPTPYHLCLNIIGRRSPIADCSSSPLFHMPLTSLGILRDFIVFFFGTPFITYRTSFLGRRTQLRFRSLSL